MRTSAFRTLLGRVAGAIGAGVFSLTALNPAPVAAHGEAANVAVSLPAAGKYLAFTDHRGRAVSERDFAGKFMLVYFGYTNCPDICPTDLQVLSQAMDILGPAGKNVQPIFIAIDQQRDTPKALADYVGHFHPRLVGLTGTKAQISAAAKAYDVHAEMVQDKKESAKYFINHTALTYLIGPGGNGIATFDHGTKSDEMAAAILKHLKNQPD